MHPLDYQSIELFSFVVVALFASVFITIIALSVQWSRRKRFPRPTELPPEIARETPSEAPPEAEQADAPISPPSAPEEVKVSAPSVGERPRQVEVPPEAPAEVAAAHAEITPAKPEITPQVEVVPPAPTKAPARLGVGLRKTREGFLSRIRGALTGSTKISEIYEGLEEALIAADVGVDTSLKLTEAVRTKLGKESRPDAIRDALKAEIEAILEKASRPWADSGDAPLVIMMVGVNGVGKTTSIAKLAAMFKRERGSVIVAAADTFRAAAVEQLQVWCDRVRVDIIKQSQGSDPAAVAFDSVKSAIARKVRTVLIDTAGRLQTKGNLMDELKKIARIAGRELPGAPHEIWLVLDANTGQNAISQAKIFGDTVKVTGVVLAKLDSSAKGGVIIAIADKLGIPVRYVGLGEEIEDLREFDPHEFADALFENESTDARHSGSYAA